MSLNPLVIFFVALYIEMALEDRNMYNKLAFLWVQLLIEWFAGFTAGKICSNPMCKLLLIIISELNSPVYWGIRTHGYHDIYQTYPCPTLLPPGFLSRRGVNTTSPWSRQFLNHPRDSMALFGVSWNSATKAPNICFCDSSAIITCASSREA